MRAKELHSTHFLCGGSLFGPLWVLLLSRLSSVTALGKYDKFYPKFFFFLLSFSSLVIESCYVIAAKGRVTMAVVRGGALQLSLRTVRNIHQASVNHLVMHSFLISKLSVE